MLVFCLIIILLCQFSESVDTSVFDYVNPFIGTGGDGFGVGCLPLGSQVPFGFMRVGADTAGIDGLWESYSRTGGYRYNDVNIRLFSHTHMVGAGVVDLGTVGVMPTNTLFDTIDTFDDKLDRFPWMQPFSHDNENATVGYYNVLLKNSSIFVELTSTNFVGAHRYTFNQNYNNNNNNANGKHPKNIKTSKNQKNRKNIASGNSVNAQKQHNSRQRMTDSGSNSSGKYIIIDSGYTLTGGDSCPNASVTIDYINQEIYGFNINNGGLSERFGGLITYFSIKLDQNFSDIVGTWKGRDITKNIKVNNSITVIGSHSGVWIEFDSESSDTVEMYVGISAISVEHARLNRENDMKLYNSFDAILKYNQDRWLNEVFNLVSVNSIGNNVHEDNITVFYTALYHTHFAPTRYDETNFEYKGFDKEIHTLQQNVYGLSNVSNHYYSDMSIWDVFRSEYPWYVQLSLFYFILFFLIFVLLILFG